MRKVILFLIFILLISAAFLLSFGNNLRPVPGLRSLYINDSRIFVEVADTIEKHAQGLSGQDSLPENQGMIFLFSSPDYYSFWMKGMKFPLDFVWINNRQVVEITQNVQPQDYQPPNTLTSKEKVNMVLQINAGMVEKMNIKIGDKIIF